MFSRTDIVGVGILLIVAIALFAPRIPWVINVTPSLPRGLYRLHPDAAPTLGDLTTFKLKDSPIDALAKRRRYVPPSGRYQKRVVAEPGDSWCVRNGRFFVRGMLWAPVFKADTDGRPLPQQSGCHVVPPRHVLVATRHPRGFDSRYFGTVEREHLEGTLTPIWIWTTSLSSHREDPE